MPWAMFERVERQARRLDDVMERLDVDPGAAVRKDHGLAFARARTKCLVCTNTALCRFWLDQGGLTPETPEFCPNAAYLDACRRRTAS